MKRFALITTVLLSATSLQAGDLLECGQLSHSSGRESDHRDLGAGVVQYRLWWLSMGIGAGQTLVVEGCQSGEAVFANYYEVKMDPETLDEAVVLDASNRVHAVLADAIQSDENVTIAKLETRFSDAGAISSLRAIQTESCACNRAYPDLRGSRQQFEWYE